MKNTWNSNTTTRGEERRERESFGKKRKRAS
jgi:hypothetical protein